MVPRSPPPQKAPGQRLFSASHSRSWMFRSELHFLTLPRTNSDDTARSVHNSTPKTSKLSVPFLQNTAQRLLVLLQHFRIVTWCVSCVKNVTVSWPEYKDTNNFILLRPTLCCTDRTLYINKTIIRMSRPEIKVWFSKQN